MEPTILITGAGGAAAVSVIKALRGPDVRIIAADMDPYAAGLYLVEEGQRLLLPPASAPDFVDALLLACRAHSVDVLIPTVDAELIPIAAERLAFTKIGTRVMCADLETLEVVLDKAQLANRLADVIRVPRTEVLDDSFDPRDWDGPVVLKPRRGAGSRGIRIHFDMPSSLPTDGRTIAQELLPGAEYSVDVIADADGNPLVAVPRVRLKIDSGIAVTARTVRDEGLETAAMDAVRALRLPYVSNVQFRRDFDGRPSLLEINPRFPGTMPLTVAAGVNMPRIALDAALGRPLPEVRLSYQEIATVRFWEEHFVEPSDIDAMLDVAAASIAA